MPITERKLRVFLCHASQDKSAVQVLYQRLLSEEWIDPWIDVKNLLPGQDWRVAIQEAVETADNVIICLSNNSVSKEGYIQKEMRYAQEISLEKPEGTIFLIPLRLDECETPRGLRFFQWTNYFGEDKEQSYEDLLKSLRSRLDEKIRKETEEKLRSEALELSRIAEEKARKDAEEKARQEAKAQARALEQRERCKAESLRRKQEKEKALREEKAKKEAEEQARKETEDRIRRQEERRAYQKERRQTRTKKFLILRRDLASN